MQQEIRKNSPRQIDTRLLSSSLTPNSGLSTAESSFDAYKSCSVGISFTSWIDLGVERVILPRMGMTLGVIVMRIDLIGFEEGRRGDIELVRADSRRAMKYQVEVEKEDDSKRWTRVVQTSTGQLSIGDIVRLW